MSDVDLGKYCQWAVERGATHAKQIHPSSVVTAAWVRWKCQFGCPGYNRSYACPPDSPTPEQTQAILDCYHCAILVHFEVPPLVPNEPKGYWQLSQKRHAMVVEMEEEIFKDGYYKAFSFLNGGCMICEECAKPTGEPCRFRLKLRPCMESSGIDVYQTARNNGFFIRTLRRREETRNLYCLVLVD